MYYFFHIMSGRALVKEEEPVSWAFKLKRPGMLGTQLRTLPAFLETATPALLGKSKASIQPWQFLRLCWVLLRLQEVGFHGWCLSELLFICSSLSPAWWAEEHTLPNLRFLCPVKGQEHFHRPALLLILGNCCRKFLLTAGLNLMEESAPVYFPGISKGLSKSSRPTKPALCSLSYS